MLKVGIIGVGTMGQFHSNAYSKIADVIIAGYADPRLDATQALAKLYNAKVANNVDELISDPKIDIIDICTPTPFHKEFTIKAAKAGKHVFCEKPIARTIPDAEEMVISANKAGVKFMVGQVLRFFPEFATAKQLIDQGKIGEPGIARLSRLSYFPLGANDWMANIEYSGGAILETIIHDFDWLNWCFGEPNRVFAQGLVYQPVYHQNRIDYALVIIRYKNGVIAHVEGSWAQPRGYFSAKLEVTGTKGQIDFSMEDSVAVNIAVRKEQQEIAKVKVPESPLVEDPYTAEIRHFVECIKNDKEPAVTGKDAINALKVCLAALESIKTGQPVNL